MFANYSLPFLASYTMEVLTTGKVEILKTVKFLGRGAFGSVELVTNAAGQQFALKNIDFSRVDPSFRKPCLRLILNEVSNLKKMDLLQGFTCDKNKAQILMSYIEGQRAGEILDASYRDDAYCNSIIKKCFIALRDLHAKGILHRDCHDYNFLVQNNSDKAVAIDLGLSTEANIFNVGNDLMMFSDCFLQGSYSSVAKLFIETTIEYAMQHKVEMAVKTLSYGVFSVGALYGLGASAALRAILFAFVKAKGKDLAYQYMHSTLEQERKSYAMGCFFNIPAFLRDANPDESIVVIVVGIIIAADMARDFANNYKKAKEVIEEIKAVYRGDKSLRDVSAEFMIKAAEVALLIYPACRMMHMGNDIFLTYIATEEQMVNSCKAVAYSKSILNYFGLVAKNANKLKDHLPAWTSPAALPAPCPK